MSLEDASRSRSVLRRGTTSRRPKRLLPPFASPLSDHSAAVPSDGSFFPEFLVEQNGLGNVSLPFLLDPLRNDLSEVGTPVDSCGVHLPLQCTRKTDASTGHLA